MQLEWFRRLGRVWQLHAGGKVIGASGEHPFHVHGQGWLEANRLRAGDPLASHDAVYDTGEYETLYNIRGADRHVYFVLGENWGFSFGTPAMPHRFDATLKNIVADRPADFADVFGLPKGEPTTSLNVDLSTISAATDVALGFGEPLRHIADLNFQSGPDPALPRRLLHFHAAFHDRHGVPVRTILVLLRPKADAGNLTGKLAYREEDCWIEFGYRIIRLWQQPVDSYLRSGLAALPLATLCQMPADKKLSESLRDVVREIERRLGTEATHAEAVRLMTAAYILTGLRVSKGDLSSIYKGVGLMQESTAFDEAIEEGEIRNSHKLLLRLGRKQLGSADAAAEAELRAIKDIERLERMADAILTAKSWEELLATP